MASIAVGGVVCFTLMADRRIQLVGVPAVIHLVDGLPAELAANDVLFVGPEFYGRVLSIEEGRARVEVANAHDVRG